MTSDVISLLRQYTLIELNHLYEEFMPVWPTHGKFSVAVQKIILLVMATITVNLALGIIVVLMWMPRHTLLTGVEPLNKLMSNN